MVLVMQQQRTVLGLVDPTALADVADSEGVSERLPAAIESDAAYAATRVHDLDRPATPSSHAHRR